MLTSFRRSSHDALFRLVNSSLPTRQQSPYEIEPSPTNLSPAIAKYPKAPILIQEDYPKVNFWTKDNYTEGGKQTDESLTVPDNENSKSKQIPWLEDENGEILSLEVANLVRTTQRAIWNEWLQNWTVIDPASNKKTIVNPVTCWAELPADLTEEFISRMTVKVPELALCANHWKVMALGTKYYMQWAHFRINGEAKEHNSSRSRSRSVSRTRSVTPAPIIVPDNCNLTSRLLLPPSKPIYNDCSLLTVSRPTAAVTKYLTSISATETESGITANVTSMEAAGLSEDITHINPAIAGSETVCITLHINV